MNDTEIREGVLRALGQVVPEARGQDVESDTTFRDQFEIDSIDYLNLVLTLEKEFGVTVPESDYPKLGSLTGAVTYLSSALSARVEDDGAG